MEKRTSKSARARIPAGEAEAEHSTAIGLFSGWDVDAMMICVLEVHKVHSGRTDRYWPSTGGTGVHWHYRSTGVRTGST